MKFEIELDENVARRMAEAYSPEKLKTTRHDPDIADIAQQLGRQVPRPTTTYHPEEMSLGLIGKRVVRWQSNQKLPASKVTPPEKNPLLHYSRHGDMSGVSVATIRALHIDGNKIMVFIGGSSTLWIYPDGWIEVIDE